MSALLKIFQTVSPEVAAKLEKELDQMQVSATATRNQVRNAAFVVMDRVIYEQPNVSLEERSVLETLPDAVVAHLFE